MHYSNTLYSSFYYQLIIFVKIENFALFNVDVKLITIVKIILIFNFNSNFKSNLKISCYIKQLNKYLINV